MNDLAEFLIATYIGLYLLALVIAVWQRKTFPLSDVITVTLIIGVGFTALVYWIVPNPVDQPALSKPVRPGELIFTITYLFLATALLIRGSPIPAAWKRTFVRKKIAALIFKLLLFVLIPLTAMRSIWNIGWEQLGFSAGDVRGQLLSTVLLVLLFGGFNLLVGSAATPIRKRQFSWSQVMAGFGAASVWNIIEVGLVEEFFFRAFLQGRLTSFFGSPIAGICMASLLFGLAHAPGIFLRRAEERGALGAKPSILNTILYTILALSPTGWFTGLLYFRAQSLLAPILVHALVDAVAHTVEFIEGLGIHKQSKTAEFQSS
jgi:membrane protease YdiL (CAAX protease family)